ncbi:hypothetical protein TRSC58_06545 [Trypanosoma rangeli SC58]|uniref:Uncharacterized protein n=1 Tax=Trypanosoma rangeli SC58 TaxID=429131 RepID=A0A061ISG1_TRYRA|nr:hypothetical protein TRSC58_06545 [Trypanosoma rangeli SC58]
MLPMCFLVHASCHSLRFACFLVSCRRPRTEVARNSNGGWGEAAVRMWSSATGKMEIRRLPSDERQRNFLEEIYANYEEVNAQQKEIARRKREMGSELPDSNRKKIYRVLFSENPSDIARFGDWDTYEKIELMLKKFVYSRNRNTSSGDTTEVALSERIDILSGIRAQQAERIASLETTLASTQEELAGLMDMLRMRDGEIKKVKRMFLMKQLEHSQQQREGEAADDAAMEQRKSVYNDMNALIEVNKVIERENARLRAALEAKEFLGWTTSRTFTAASGRQPERADGGRKRESTASSSVNAHWRKTSHAGGEADSPAQVNTQNPETGVVAPTAPPPSTEGGPRVGGEMGTYVPSSPQRGGTQKAGSVVTTWIEPLRTKRRKTAEATDADDSEGHDLMKAIPGARRRCETPSFSASSNMNFGKSATNMEQLGEIEARRRYIQQQAPMTSVLMRLHKERIMWQRLLEAEAANTMTFLDHDANVPCAARFDPGKDSVDLSAASFARLGSQASRPFDSTVHLRLSGESVKSYRRGPAQSLSGRRAAIAEARSRSQSPGNASTVSSGYRTSEESAGGEGTMSSGESRSSLSTAGGRKKARTTRRRAQRKPEQREAKQEQRKLGDAVARPSRSHIQTSANSRPQSCGGGGRQRRSTAERGPPRQEPKMEDATVSSWRASSPGGAKVKATEEPRGGSTVSAASTMIASCHEGRERHDVPKEEGPSGCQGAAGHHEALHALKLEMGTVRDKHQRLRAEMDEFFLAFNQYLRMLRDRNGQLENGVRAERAAVASAMAEEIVGDMVEQRVFERLEQHGIVLQRHSGPASALTDEEWAHNQFYDAICNMARGHVAGELVKAKGGRKKRREDQQGTRPTRPQSHPPPPSPTPPCEVTAPAEDASPSAGKAASGWLPRPHSGSHPVPGEPDGEVWPAVAPQRPPSGGPEGEGGAATAGGPTSSGYKHPAVQLGECMSRLAARSGGTRGEYETAPGAGPALPLSAAFPHKKEEHPRIPLRHAFPLLPNVGFFSSPLGNAGLIGHADWGHNAAPPPKRFEGNVLEYLRSLQPRRPAGGVEDMAPAVRQYDFQAALAEVRAEFRGAARVAAAQLRKPLFENAFKNQILPYAAAAKSLQNGQRMPPWMLAAVRQLRAEEERRNGEMRRHLFQRVATNLRARRLLRSNVCRGLAMAAYVIVLWEKWLECWRKKSAVQRIEKAADINRMLDLLAANLRGRPRQRPDGAGNLPDARTTLFGPSSSHFSEVRFPPTSA